MADKATKRDRLAALFNEKSQRALALGNQSISNQLYGYALRAKAGRYDNELDELIARNGGVA